MKNRYFSFIEILLYRCVVCVTKRLSRFTLIELLVVIAIISILMSMLLPALSSARKSAKAVVCQNHMKQNGFLISIYNSDYQNYWYCLDTDTVPYSKSWAYILYENGYLNLEVDPAFDATDRTFPSCPIVMCPESSYRARHPHNMLKYDVYAANSYGRYKNVNYYAQVKNGDDAYFIPFLKIHEPSQFLLINDNILTDWVPDRLNFRKMWPWDDSNLRFWAAHAKNQAMTLFADMHAKNSAREDLMIWFSSNNTEFYQ